MKYWLIVERIENWQADERTGFRHFGIPDRKVGLAKKVSAGDQIFVYVSSGISAIAGSRQATHDSTVRPNHPTEYDEPFTNVILTAPTCTLPRDKWIPFAQLVENLSFTKNKPNWGPESRRVHRRLFRLSHAAMADSVSCS